MDLTVNAKYFDTEDTRITYDIGLLKSQIQDVLDEISINEKKGAITEEDILLYYVYVKQTQEEIKKLNAMPIVKFYKKFDYFAFKHYSLSKMNYN
jgi:hypothetical protein